MYQRNKSMMQTGRNGLLGLVLTLVVVSCSQEKGSKLNKNNPPARVSTTEKTAVTPPERANEMTVGELKSALAKGEDFFLLDVRSRAEYQAGHVAGVDKLIPHTQVISHLEELPADKSRYVYCICRSGRRSGYATNVLKTQGYTHVYNVIGGMNAWTAAGYPVTR